MNKEELKQFDREFDELLSHFKQVSEINNSNTSVNHMRRRTNTELELELKSLFITHTNQLLEKRNKEVINILSKTNYEQEEWYASSERPDTLTHFEANQINIRTRNKIQELLTDETKKDI